MHNSTLYQQTLQLLENKLSLLSDKFEETLESTINACWLKAAGFPKSAENALLNDLPNLSDSQELLFKEYIDNRLNNIPLAHITGRQQFFGIELLSDNRALIPRKETELLAKKALELSWEIHENKYSVNAMDICCGAGNIGLSLAYYNPNIMVNATDLSEDAVALTVDNINFLNLHRRVRAKQGNLFSAFDKNYHNTVDIILCNPPYIPSHKVVNLHKETLINEPKIAFDGGISGVDIIGEFIQYAPQYLKVNGYILIEVGVGQGEFVSLLCKRTGFYNDVSSVVDVNGNIRVVIARKK